MNLFSALKEEIKKIIEELQQQKRLPEGLPVDQLELVPPRDPSHGDMATNAAMIFAAKSSMKPRDIAEILKEPLSNLSGISAVEIAGPGFINLRFAPEFWQRVIPAILNEGRGYGSSDIGKGRKVNVEYVSVNPTGPVHIGHVRGAVYGDVLAMLLIKAGYNVTKEYYINDAGGQVNTLAESAFLRYREALGESIGEIPEGLYPGDYLIPVGEALAKNYGDSLTQKSKDEWLPIVREFAVEAMLEMIKDDLRLLGIQHDVFTSERALTLAGRVEEALKILEDKGLIYVGVLEPPKGKTPDDWEPRPQTLFKSSEFGDDLDRAIKKSDGSWTYFAPDIAYHYDKVKRGHELLIDVLGADHGGYAKRIKAAVKALAGDRAELDVKLCQMVKFLRGGEQAKMSKRAGTFVTARDVVEEVGKDVLRFIMLTRKNDAPLDFDFQKVTEQSKDNPVFYVQYAHARAKSVLRNAKEELLEAYILGEKNDSEHLNRLNSTAELDLIRLLASWPRMVEGAALAYEPHRIAFYLLEVAEAFHGLWNKGNEDISLRFIIKDDIKLTSARLMRVGAVATVIASGLLVLGVEPVEEMR